MTHPTTPRWSQALARITALQTTLSREQPWRDGGSPAPRGASEESLQAAERRLGRALPPSYRAFLRQHDGWERLFDGASLLPAHRLGDPRHAEVAATIFRTSSGPGGGADTGGRRARLLPFGIDADATTLFAFNPGVIAANGEYEIIAWIGELGVRRASFSAFLDLVLELYEGEITSGAAAPPAVKLARIA